MYSRAERSAGWGNRGSDVPKAIAAETDGPGDDIGIELANTTTRLEVQVKRGLSGKSKLTGALQTLLAGYRSAPRSKAYWW